MNRYFVYGLIVGVACLCVAAGAFANRGGDLCFGAQAAHDCGQSSATPYEAVNTPYGTLHLAYLESQVVLAGNLTRATACTEWRVRLIWDPLDPKNLIFNIVSSDPSGVCLGSLAAPQAVERLEATGSDTVFTVIVNGEVDFVGKLAPGTLPDFKTSPQDNLI